MELKDYYVIMGVKLMDDFKIIKIVYCWFVCKYYPDVSKELDVEVCFKEVVEVWEVLSDE